MERADEVLNREQLEKRAASLAADVLDGRAGALEELDEVERQLRIEERLRRARDDKRRQEQWDRERPAREAESERERVAREERERLAQGTEDWQEVHRLLAAVRGFVDRLSPEDKEDDRRRFLEVVEQVRRQYNIDSRASLLAAAERAPALAAASLVEAASPLAASPGRDGRTQLESSQFGQKLVDALSVTARALEIDLEV